MKSILVPLACAFAIAACDDSSGPARLEVRVEGVVTHATTGEPLDSVSLTVSRILPQAGTGPLAMAESDSQGGYHIAFSLNEACEPEGQLPSPMSLAAAKPGFIAPVIIGFPECTEELQHRDIEMQPQ